MDMVLSLVANRGLWQHAACSQNADRNVSDRLGFARTSDVVWFLVLAAIWSSSFMFIKIGVATIPPLTLAAGRLALATLLLWGYVLFSGVQIPLRASTWGAFGFIGFFGNALPFSLISWGEQYIDSSLAAILMGIMPVATVILAHLSIPEEPFTARRILGVLCGFGGLLVLVGWQALSGIGAGVIAQLAVLGGALSYAVTTVFTRKYVRVSGRIMAAGATLAGTVWVLPIALWLEQPWTAQPSSESLLAAVYLGVFPTAVATLILFRLISAIGATTFAQINYLIPLLGLGWGVLFLAEQPTARAILALIFVLTGVALVNSARPPRTATSA